MKQVNKIYKHQLFIMILVAGELAQGIEVAIKFVVVERWIWVKLGTNRIDDIFSRITMDFSGECIAELGNVF